MDAKKYRNKQETIETTSGETFTMRKLTGTRVVELFEEAGVTPGQDVSLNAKEAIELAMRVVPEAIEEVVSEGKGDDAHIAVDELYFSDLMDLFGGILTNSVGKEATAKAEAFRLAATPEGSSDSGPSLWEVADGSPGPSVRLPPLEPKSDDLGPGRGD